MEENSITKNDSLYRYVDEVRYIFCDYNVQDNVLIGFSASYSSTIRKKIYVITSKYQVEDTPISYGKNPAESPIFISKKSRISRAMLRNDYDITYDKSKAKTIVLSYKEEFVDTDRAQMIFFNEENGKNFLYIVYCNIPRFLESIKREGSIEDMVKPSLISRFPEMYGYYCADSDMKKWIQLSYVNSEEKAEQLTNKYPKMKYVYDNNLKVSGVTKISGEVLYTWNNISDSNILKKCILASDWQNYPVTMSIFLYEHNEITISPEIKPILSNINYDNVIYNLRSNHPNMVIQPDDYNMAMDWAAFLLGTESERAIYVDRDKMSKLPLYLYTIIRTKIAVNLLHVNSVVPLSVLKK